MQLLYITLLGIPMVVVAAFVTLADSALFPHYAAAPRLWGLSPLEDQKIGGTIMWVPGHLAFLVALTIVFFRWAREDAAQAGMSAAAHAPPQADPGEHRPRRWHEGQRGDSDRGLERRHE